ncbi:ABC transporter ATP-binding protein, partial [bacterium]|nr:ABC transporter ATP-binding protein [bacterium]
GTRALDNVSLEIKRGETMAILGPSGCGKSTLLRIIAGLESVEEGAVYYDDKDVTDMPPKDRGIGMVFQNYALYPNYKSRGNLSFFFWVHKRSEEEIDERVKETSRIMGMGFDRLLGRMPTTLSGGEQQRVAIGRCIVRYPTIFLMDEPISNLDAKLRVRTRGEIKKLLIKFAITTVYVTHDQVEAIAMGDRITVMRKGKIIQVGTYDEIYAHPVNRFVAEFVGKPPMNFFEGEISERNLFKSPDFSLTLPAEKLSKLNGEREVFLGIRPEDINLLPGPVKREEEKDFIKGWVEIIEPNFAERAKTVYIRVGSSNFSAKVDESVPIKVGDRVKVIFDKEKIHLFSREDERMLV